MPLDPTSLSADAGHSGADDRKRRAGVEPLARRAAGGRPAGARLALAVKADPRRRARRPWSAQPPPARQTLKKPVAAGARFLVSPGTTTAHALATPTAVRCPAATASAGAMASKFFPAERPAAPPGSRRWPSRCRASVLSHRRRQHRQCNRLSGAWAAGRRIMAVSHPTISAGTGPPHRRSWRARCRAAALAHVPEAAGSRLAKRT